MSSTQHLAMSTGWNSRRHLHARDVVDEIMGLGIHNLEAGCALNETQLADLAELAPKVGVRVNSIHNFCPTPPSHRCPWGDDFLLSSPVPEERERGLESTRQTFLWAQRLGAHVIVMHLGQVSADRAIYNQIKQMAADPGSDPLAFAETVAEAKGARAKMAEPYLTAVRISLDTLVRDLPAGMRLGIETRANYYEIPNLEEMARLMAEYGDAVGYWHDAGHAFMQERTGFCRHAEFIRAFHGSLLGMHIHDAVGLSDHHAPGRGEIGLEMYKPYLNDGIFPVLELHPRVTREEAANGIEFLKTKEIM